MSLELAFQQAIETAVRKQLEPLLSTLALNVKTDKFDDEYWKTNRAAEYLGIKPLTMVFWRHQKRGPHYIKLGTAVRYRKSDLDTFAEANKQMLGLQGRPPKSLTATPQVVETSGKVTGMPPRKRKHQGKGS